MDQTNKSDWLTALFRIVIAVFMLFFLGVLSISAIVGTTGMEIVKEGEGVDTVVQRIREQIEAVVFYNDNILTNLIWLVLGFCLVFLLMPLLKKLPLWSELTFVAVWTIVIGSIWIFSSQVAPNSDSYQVSDAALNFANNDYSVLTGDDRYFRNYPFQLGFVFFEEILIRGAGMFGDVENLLFIQEVSVIMLASSYVALLLMINQIFEDKRVRHTAFVLLIFCIQPVISCTFLYGIIPGFVFSAWAVYLEINFIKSESWKKKILWGILSVLCITAAVVIKSNNLIVLVAMVLLAIVTAFRNKKSLFNLLLSAVSVVLCVVTPDMVTSMYEKRADVQFGDSIPMISWFAMGLQEAENAPGWYNYGATLANFENSGYDADAASESSLKEIRKRIDDFSVDKQYRNDFFYKKFTSVWNETSYQSIWNNNVRLQYKEKTGIAEWVCNDGETATKSYMDAFAQLIFILCFCGILYCLKHKNTYAMIMMLITLGGMMYHLLAEAKSQYALPYFIWMTVFASCGFIFVYDKVKPCISKFIDKHFRRNKTLTESGG
ncbi:MAG: hypothetical protein LUD57_07740 [Ruminococcus sp.]|nr:hypothetical protein [Ruminococcus sp.]